MGVEVQVLSRAYRTVMGRRENIRAFFVFLPFSSSLRLGTHLAEPSMAERAIVVGFQGTVLASEMLGTARAMLQAGSVLVAGHTQWPTRL